MKEKIIFQYTRNEKNEIDGKTVTFKNIFKRKKKTIEGSRRGSLYSGFKTTGFFLAGEILVAENEPLNFCPFVT